MKCNICGSEMVEIPDPFDDLGDVIYEGSEVKRGFHYCVCCEDEL